jgi:hypothetical protein
LRRPKNAATTGAPAALRLLPNDLNHEWTRMDTKRLILPFSVGQLFDLVNSCLLVFIRG